MSLLQQALLGWHYEFNAMQEPPEQALALGHLWASAPNLGGEDPSKHKLPQFYSNEHQSQNPSAFSCSFSKLKVGLNIGEGRARVPSRFLRDWSI